MPKLTGSLETRTIYPTSDPILDGFCCGKKNGRSEREVHEVVDELRKGLRPVPEVRVTEEVPPGNLVGVSAVGFVYFNGNPRLKQFDGSPYITVIGLSEHYRGKEVRGDRPPLGDVVLLDAIRTAKRRTRGGIPWMFAFIEEANKDCVAMFEDRGFELVVPAPTPASDGIYRRAKGLSIGYQRK